MERHPSLWSTSGEARERVHRGELPAARVIVAAIQTGAYGRRGRAWQAPEGGLWWTLAIPQEPEGPSAAAHPDDAERLGLRVGAACLATVTDALRPAEVASERITLKWPNDVLIDGCKTLGCLCERVVEGVGSRRMWLIVGVGLNVNNDPQDLGPSLRRPPTSLRAIADREFDLEALGADLTRRVLGAVKPQSDAQWLAALRQIAGRLHGIDEPIRLSLPGGEMLHGTLAGLSDTGRLVVQTERGRVVAAPGAEILAANSASGTDSQ